MTPGYGLEEVVKRFFGIFSLSWILALGLLAGCSGEPSAERDARGR